MRAAGEYQGSIMITASHQPWNFNGEPRARAALGHSTGAPPLGARAHTGSARTSRCSGIPLGVWGSPRKASHGPACLLYSLRRPQVLCAGRRAGEEQHHRARGHGDAGVTRREGGRRLPRTRALLARLKSRLGVSMRAVGARALRLPCGSLLRGARWVRAGWGPRSWPGRERDRLHLVNSREREARTSMPPWESAPDGRRSFCRLLAGVRRGGRDDWRAVGRAGAGDCGGARPQGRRAPRESVGPGVRDGTACCSRASVARALR